MVRGPESPMVEFSTEFSAVRNELREQSHLGYHRGRVGGIGTNRTQIGRIVLGTPPMAYQSDLGYVASVGCANAPLEVTVTIPGFVA